MVFTVEAVVCERAGALIGQGAEFHAGASVLAGEGVAGIDCKKRVDEPHNNDNSARYIYLPSIQLPRVLNNSCPPFHRF